MGALYLRAEDQYGKIHELVCAGEFQPLPNVGDTIQFNDFAGKVEARNFGYGEDNVLQLSLKVRLDPPELVDDDDSNATPAAE